jgi:hypothetical protein
MHVHYMYTIQKFEGTNLHKIESLIYQGNTTFWQKTIRLNVPNLAQVVNWRSLIKMSLELQSCPLFQINRLDHR